MSHFGIRCTKCDKVLEDTYFAFCEHCTDSLLVTEFIEKEFRDDAGEGLWKYNWLPVHKPKSKVNGPIVFRSKGLGSSLGLDNLYISFSGYWPEAGAQVKSCTFKEFEAAVVIENARDNRVDGLVVASAGNTARAFAHLSEVTGYRAIIVVPLMCLDEMWYLEPPGSLPTVVISDGDYSDAIDMAKKIAIMTGLPFEGGVMNIAKRDGLGAVMLEAASAIGRLPDHYFQAVGSGAGTIAAWEASKRFQSDKRFQGVLPRLHIAQNLPFAPMVKAWQRGERTLRQEDLSSELAGQISTRVLSSRYPSYDIMGGVFDALTDTRGFAYGVTNKQAAESGVLFEQEEGIDIVPAAMVAVGALRQAVKAGNVSSDDVVLLNITGGGEKRLRQEVRVYDVNGLHVSKNTPEDELKFTLCGILGNIF